jgi:6-pyruvoyl-tetrahydropterin synthase-like protein
VKTDRFLTIGIVIWGALLAFWLVRGHFLIPADRILETHESYTYSGRLVEFRDMLRAGYWSPEWTTNFRGGLGAPYFTFYQSGFFYAASLVPWSVPPTRALGIAVAAFALLGYLATFGLVGRRFGRVSGWLAASSLLLAVYPATDITIRGNLSEFSAMMVLPACLWALAGWLEDRRPGYLVGLAIAGGMLIATHPVVGMLGWGLLSLILAVFLCHTRQLRATLIAGVALGVAVGLAAFFWVPVFFGRDLVNSQPAFEGFYSYTNHFVSIGELLGPYHRHAIVPFALGPIIIMLIGFNGLVLLGRWEITTVAQRYLLILSLTGMLLFGWLMTSSSAFVWQCVSPLRQMQFPWRIFTVITVLAAVAVGSMLPWKAERLRTAAVGIIVLLMWGLSGQYSAYRIDPEIRSIGSVDQLLEINFTPDLCHEWAPRGAEMDIARDQRIEPAPGPGCRVDQFARRQGRLSCRVQTGAESFVIMPHYFLPVGWEATLDGRIVELTADSRGLMRVDLPGNVDGTLEIVFSRTPLRRLGLIVSGFSLLGGVVLLALLVRKRGRGQSLQSTHRDVPTN